MTRSTDCPTRRRAVAAVITALLITVLLGFTAIAVDLSWLAAARRQEQTSVDNCALATAHFIANQPLGFDRRIVSKQATDYGKAFMPINPVEHIPLTPDSVETGIAIHENGPDSKVVGFVPGDIVYDAVRVFVTMSEDRNQSLPAFFGTILGVNHFEPQAEAIVLLDITAGGMIPFTVHQKRWNSYLDPQGPFYQDDWSWNGTSVEEGRSDGIPEIVMYPDRDIPCNGNFGALNIDIDSQSLPELSQQIQFGVSSEALENEILADYDIELDTYLWVDQNGQAYVTSDGEQIVNDLGDPFEFLMGEFVRPNGNPFDAQITGEPGLRIGKPLRDALDLRLGQIVGIFIHTQCGPDTNGSNALYTIPEIRYARLMGYQLKTNNMWIVVQPTGDDPSAIIDIEVAGLGK